MQHKYLSPLHEEARRLAEAGTPVFPCHAGTKVPATDHGFHDATCDVGQIDAWWTAHPDYNIAFSPHMVGLSVLDLDGPQAQAEWAALELEHGLTPDTYVVETPRPGGLHLYFRGELPPTQHKLGAHIDTRGRGSYALLPPSRTTDGVYRPAASNPAGGRSAAVQCPAWVLPFIEGLKKDRQGAVVSDLDTPGNIMRAVSHLTGMVARGDVAVSGEGGNHKTYAVACDLFNLGLSQPEVFKQLSDVYNPACLPPWDDAELETIVENSSRYAQNDQGAWAAGSSADTFGHILGSIAAEPDEPRRSRFAPMTLGELAALPPPTWLIPERLPAERVTMLYGQPSSYKSFIALADALMLAAAGTPVVYVAGEGSRELELRAEAWKTLNEVDRDLPIWIVGDMPWASDTGHFEEFIAQVKPLSPALVVIDTVARSMIGLNENDAKDMGAFVAFVEGLKRRLNAAILVVHHSGKDTTNGPRGSGALLASVDAAHEVKADKTSKTVEVWVRRMKDAPERERPWTYRAQPFGQSLAFIPTTPGEHRMLTAAPEQLASGRRVGGALKEMGAVGDQNGVTTRALAAQLVPPGENESPEAREQAVSLLARALNTRASSDLEVYARGEGRARVWCLPSGD